MHDVNAQTDWFFLALLLFTLSQLGCNFNLRARELLFTHPPYQQRYTFFFWYLLLGDAIRRRWEERRRRKEWNARGKPDKVAEKLDPRKAPSKAQCGARISQACQLTGDSRGLQGLVAPNLFRQYVANERNYSCDARAKNILLAYCIVQLKTFCLERCT